MITREELLNIKKTRVIPDRLLPDYLADKLTTKPDYGFDTTKQSLSIEDFKNQIDIKKNRDERNNNVRNKNGWR
jgi:hypothetical protein